MIIDRVQREKHLFIQDMQTRLTRSLAVNDRRLRSHLIAILSGDNLGLSVVTTCCALVFQGRNQRPSDIHDLGCSSCTALGSFVNLSWRGIAQEETT